jgi:hypothetical protein
VDELAGTVWPQYDPDVRRARTDGREEDEVAGLKAVPVHAVADTLLLGYGPRHGEMMAFEDEADHAAAVEAGRRLLAAQAVVHAEQAERGADQRVARRIRHARRRRPRRRRRPDRLRRAGERGGAGAVLSRRAGRDRRRHGDRCTPDGAAEP